jgi:hypothetical protein
MVRRTVRIPGQIPLFDIVSYGKVGPSGSRGFTATEIQSITRTVRRAPEVMVKVTGGDKNAGAAAAHFSYISRGGDLEIETDLGERITDREEQKALLNSWQLELSAGQYRKSQAGKPPARRLKLTHHIVLSMPAPTPPQKVRVAAREFAREKFGATHRYAMVLHTDQQHPHVHLVVKTESEHGKRLHIDKLMLRDWRESFARRMREQGIQANASSRRARGHSKAKRNDGLLRAQRRRASYVLRERVTDIAREVAATGRVRDPARERLLANRKVIAEQWLKAADVLDRQGEVVLAGDVRLFVHRLPRVLTDKEALADKFVRHLEAQAGGKPAPEQTRNRQEELTR